MLKGGGAACLGPAFPGWEKGIDGAGGSHVAAVAPSTLPWHPDSVPAPPDGWLKLKGNKPSGETNA